MDYLSNHNHDSHALIIAQRYFIDGSPTLDLREDIVELAQQIDRNQVDKIESVVDGFAAELEPNSIQMRYCALQQRFNSLKRPYARQA